MADFQQSYMSIKSKKRQFYWNNYSDNLWPFNCFKHET